MTLLRALDMNLPKHARFHVIEEMTVISPTTERIRSDPVG